jgi:hypothetical protein
MVASTVSDPDPHESSFDWSPGSGSGRSKKGKNATKNPSGQFKMVQAWGPLIHTKNQFCMQYQAKLLKITISKTFSCLHSCWTFHLLYVSIRHYDQGIWQCSRAQIANIFQGHVVQGLTSNYPFHKKCYIGPVVKHVFLFAFAT